MACEYFVNGEWISENKFKSLLNNGLLDNLINNNTIDLEGFNIKEENIINPESIITDKSIIPAKKLAEILVQEVSTRQGYPLNILSALELNDTETDFKIPLWASPYSDKFESLLTSLVSNKIVKQKFPGHSYVLGSQEGFQIKEGSEVNSELSKSGIVFSQNFDPKKGLQPMRYDSSTNKILPAQIMIPFKFRDDNGKILNLKDFTKTTEEDLIILDFDKIPQKVLNLFGFRIPTQERNSMAAVEIVGFLPEASGDLILAPRDFTKQMGSDFDVDKLYTYMYNTYYKDGKLHTNFESNKDKIKKKQKELSEELKNIKAELKITEEEDKIIQRYISREDDNDEQDGFTNILDSLGRKSKNELLDQLENIISELSILERSYKASRQNNLLDIHLKIMTSTSPEIISSIMALDSFGEFEDLSKEINKIRLDRGLIPQISTILSETYQRTKYINATAGKDGVGTFSLDSTFNATAQGKELIYLKLSEAATDEFNKSNPDYKRILEINSTITTFGNIKSKGDLSNKYTLRSQEIIKKAKGRSLSKEEQDSLKMKSSIIRALQSSAVDNEKAQILDKLNINNETFDTIRALAILGFEEEDIIGLLTQEIIWEYIDLLKASQSSLSGYNPNASEDIINSLKNKYDNEKRLDDLSNDETYKFSSSSGKELIDNIKNKKLIETNPNIDTPDFNIEQLLLLDKFIYLQDIGKTIKQLQSTINTESKGIAKSLLEVDAKVKQIESLPLNIYNANKLLGNYVNGKLSEPTTINGYASYYGTMVANKIFSSYFPYQKSGFNAVVEEIIKYLPNNNLSSTQEANVTDEIFANVRSYLYSNPKIGLFTENADIERQRIFIDSENNTSLASILSTISTQPWFLKNGFLNKLSFDLNKNGDISRIMFESATGENFDERNIYLGFLYLLDNNYSIGTFNNQEYTTRTLAQDLIAASFLEGGNQGAKQYLKYIPTSYLKSVNFGNYLQSISFDFDQTFGGISLSGNLSYTTPSRFARQFFQNNPEKAKTLDLKSKKPLEQFALSGEDLENNLVLIYNPITGEETYTQTQFLSIYDNKVIAKYRLYEFDSVNRNYNQIPTLKGSYSFNQYNPLVDKIIPLSEKNIIKKISEQQHPSYIEPESTNENINNDYKLKKGSDLNIKYNLTDKKALDNLLNSLELSDSVYSYNRKLIEEFRKIDLPKDFKIEYINSKDREKASYNSTTDTLVLNMYHLNNVNVNEIATLLIHELTHTFTAKAINDYENGNFESLTKEQIKSIESLENIQKEYIEYLVKTGKGKELVTYYNTYHTWTYNLGQITKERLDYLIKKGPNGIDEKSNIISNEKFSPEDHSKYYGAIKLSEFVSMALTDEGFQKQLNRIKNKEGKSFWSEIIDSLINLLDSLGIKIKSDSLLPIAIEESLNLIKSPQKNIDETFNSNNLNQNYLLPENFPLNPSEYQKYLLICGK